MYYILVSCTGRISEWLTLTLSLFAHRKRITERCSLRDAFSGNADISTVYKRRRSGVILTHSWYLELNPPIKRIFQNFHILTTFCNLFMERPSWYPTLFLSNSASEVSNLRRFINFPETRLFAVLQTRTLISNWLVLVCIYYRRDLGLIFTTD